MQRLGKLKDRKEKLMGYFKDVEEINITEIKSKMPFATSFGELRWIKTFIEKTSNKSSSD